MVTADVLSLAVAVAALNAVVTAALFVSLLQLHRSDCGYILTSSSTLASDADMPSYPVRQE
jgi:hypothetical protein